MLTLKTVLVVDDDFPEVAEVAKDLLRNTNYIATSARNSKEAWNILNTQVFYDIVVAGGRKGFDLLVKIKMDPRFKAVRLVSMSGGDNFLTNGCKELDARFLPKPFDKEQLLEVLR